jgi:hypothetical protein
VTSPSESPVDAATAVSKPWFVYLVRAANGSLYCGISDDPVRRFAKHQSGKGARFFLSSPAMALVYTERLSRQERSAAPGTPDQEAQEKRQGMPGGASYQSD